VFSGSADELEKQQGIAHLTEHVAYMGSRKRERLFGTGSQTNAYTDFHHTVFYAACPVTNPNTGQPMLSMALDALCDVMEAKVEPSRLEKERAAVLSEMTMVNTIEYRVECQILSTLHRENRLAKRFPIGKEVLIRNWQTNDVKTWHRTHYRPDNVLLYVVGDVSPKEVESKINDIFGHIKAEKQALEMDEDVKSEAGLLADAVMGGTVKCGMSWHYPPVVHNWCLPRGEEAPLLEGSSNEIDYDGQLQTKWPLDENPVLLPETELKYGKTLRPHIFKHELLQSFSLHIFAKRPVEPLTSLNSLKRSLAKRVALAALQIRLNVSGRSDDPPFTFVEFNELDSAREGCAVCSLDLTAKASRWRDAVIKSVSEIRKLGLYGVTPNEFERYAGALLTDADQLAAQGDRISHGDQLAYLMETVANGHIVMSPMQSLEWTLKALQSMSVEEVNNAAKELCGHILGLEESEEGDEGVIIAVACSPKNPASAEEDCTVEELVECIKQGCRVPVQPEEDVAIPHTLVDESSLKKAMEAHPASWLPGSFTDGTPNTPSDVLTSPFTLRRLSNGIRVGVAQLTSESQRGHLRVMAPGGRDYERQFGFKSGSMAVGARTMQEGGAFGPWTREQVELFCVDHLIMVEINCSEEAVIFDFTFPTGNVGNTGYGEDMQMGITGTEAVLQIVREIVSTFNWEEDALRRSKNYFNQAHEGMLKNLEGRTTEVIMEGITGNDDRFLTIEVDQVESITLEEAKQAVMSQLLPENIEISAVGDFDPQQVLDMIYNYLGTIPKDVNDSYRVTEPVSDDATAGCTPSLPLPGKHLTLELPDSDPRAVAYVSGAAPNMWGYLSDGTTVSQALTETDKKASEKDKRRRAHPLFANVALSLLSEIANRRLFSTVRERKQLTYDANFSLTGFERLMGGYFLVTVTASKENAQKALDACKETLEALRKNSPITQDNLEAAKRVVRNRHEQELHTTRYWAELMGGMQSESIPLKGPFSFTEFVAMVDAITTRDLQLTLETLSLDSDTLYTAIGQTIQPEGSEISDDIVREQPGAIGMKRGGALMG
jgi:predicted Zn-dependent peptidase